MRAFNHIGPGQAPSFAASGLAARIARAARDGSTTLAVGNLTPRRDFTDVRDIVRGYRLAATRGTPGAVYNVCSGIDRSIEELARGLLAASQTDLDLVTDPELVRPVDTPVVRGDSSRLRAETGWEPVIPFAESLADIMADARSRLDG